MTKKVPPEEKVSGVGGKVDDVRPGGSSVGEVHWIILLLHIYVYNCKATH